MCLLKLYQLILCLVLASLPFSLSHAYWLVEMMAMGNSVAQLILVVSGNHVLQRNP